MGNDKGPRLVRLLCLCLVLHFRASIAEADWWGPDAFDEIKERIDAVTKDNCQEKSSDELHLSSELLSQLPKYNQLHDRDVPENRTNLLHLHNMALNRAMFYSYIMQRLDKSEDFPFQPGLMYYHLSAAADVGPDHTTAVSSGIMYDTNSSYPNWHRDLSFNSTLPLFGPRAWGNMSMDPTTVVQDYGAGPNHNYVSDDHQLNDWYEIFLPDGSDMAGLDSVRKSTYDVDIDYGDGEGNHDYTARPLFFGPALDPKRNGYLPVVFTSPYFDCGHTNMWIVDAVSPVLDYLPRYTVWFHLQRFRFAAVSTQSIDFQSIDHNQCPLGIGNEPPNYLHGTARCKKTTVCHPLPGFGFNRGGYECRCLPGLVYPTGQEEPFRGVDIENAAQEEYEEGFDCVTKTSEASKPKAPTKKNVETDNARSKRASFRPRFTRDFGQKLSEHYSHELNTERAQEPLQYKESVDANSCKNFSTEQLRLSRDATYGVEKLFANQVNTNLRLARFLSGYLQNLDRESNNRLLRSNLPMHTEHYFGEALANVMGDIKIVASGVFFDENKFVGPLERRRYFAPWVHKDFEPGMYPTHYKAYDLSSDGPGYLQEDWFAEVKSRWTLSLEGLQRYEDTSYIRSDHEGNELVEHVTYTYYAARNASDGFWDQAIFPCNGTLDTWQITHSLPFFGPTSDKLDIEFKGVVTVTVLLDDLDINQCPMPLSEFNLFANTAVCEDTNTTCVPSHGGGFKLDQYTCVLEPIHSEGDTNQSSEENDDDTTGTPPPEDFNDGSGDATKPWNNLLFILVFSMCATLAI